MRTAMDQLLSTTKLCEESFLQPNISKTKDTVIDFRKLAHKHFEDTLIKGQTVECVQSYKYLGTIVDSKPQTVNKEYKLNFEANSEA